VPQTKYLLPGSSWWAGGCGDLRLATASFSVETFQDQHHRRYIH
jgi:hypothetical protein